MMRGKRHNYKFLLLVTAIITLAMLAPAAADIPPTEASSVEGRISSFMSDTATTSINNYWHLSRIGTEDAWQITTGQAEVIIAVLDTGIDTTHPVLADKVIAEVNLTSSPTVSDRHGHGTHIAGIIAGGIDELGRAIGIAYDCKLMNVKVANDDGTLSAVIVADGIRWAVDNGANIINMSFTIYADSPELKEAVEYAWQQGAILIAAAGNRFTGRDSYPAMYPEVIAVAATGESDALASWSNRGDWVDVSAPGTGITSAAPQNLFVSRNGTSQSAALVAGEAALLFSLAVDTNNDGRVNDEVRNAILDSCEEAGTGSTLVRIINVFNAITTLQAPVTFDTAAITRFLPDAYRLFTYY